MLTVCDVLVSFFVQADNRMCTGAARTQLARNAGELLKTNAVAFLGFSWSSAELVGAMPGILDARA